MTIKKPVCPHCGGKDVRIMQTACPGYFEIYVLFACFECKEHFKDIIKMEE